MLDLEVVALSQESVCEIQLLALFSLLSLVRVAHSAPAEAVRFTVVEQAFLLSCYPLRDQKRPGTTPVLMELWAFLASPVT